MESKRFEKGNEMIAKFMYPTFLEELESGQGSFKEDAYFKMFYFYKDFDKMQYHSSFEWLMPVIEKIESFPNIVVSIAGTTCKVFNFKDLLFSQFAETKIEATWGAVIKFIEYYNYNAGHIWTEKYSLEE